MHLIFMGQGYPQKSFNVALFTVIGNDIRIMGNFLTSAGRNNP